MSIYPFPTGPAATTTPARTPLSFLQGLAQRIFGTGPSVFASPSAFQGPPKGAPWTGWDTLAGIGSAVGNAILSQRQQRVQAAMQGIKDAMSRGDFAGAQQIAASLPADVRASLGYSPQSFTAAQDQFKQAQIDRAQREVTAAAQEAATLPPDQAQQYVASRIQALGKLYPPDVMAVVTLPTRQVPGTPAQPGEKRGGGEREPGTPAGPATSQYVIPGQQQVVAIRDAYPDLIRSLAGPLAGMADQKVLVDPRTGQPDPAIRAQLVQAINSGQSLDLQRQQAQLSIAAAQANAPRPFQIGTDAAGKPVTLPLTPAGILSWTERQDALRQQEADRTEARRARLAAQGEAAFNRGTTFIKGYWGGRLSTDARLFEQVRQQAGDLGKRLQNMDPVTAIAAINKRLGSDWEVSKGDPTRVQQLYQAWAGSKDPQQQAAAKAIKPYVDLSGQVTSLQSRMDTLNGQMLTDQANADNLVPPPGWTLDDNGLHRSGPNRVPASVNGEQTWRNNPNGLVNAIYVAEGSGKVDPQWRGKLDNKAWIKQQLGTYFQQWTQAGKPGDFLQWAANLWAPVGAQNDPGGLNVNWLPNVVANLGGGAPPPAGPRNPPKPTPPPGPRTPPKPGATDPAIVQDAQKQAKNGVPWADFSAHLRAQHVDPTPYQRFFASGATVPQNMALPQSPAATASGVAVRGTRAVGRAVGGVLTPASVPTTDPQRAQMLAFLRRGWGPLTHAQRIAVANKYGLNRRELNWLNQQTDTGGPSGGYTWSAPGWKNPYLPPFVAAHS